MSNTPKVEIIVAVGNYVPGVGYPIGKDGKTPWNRPSDLKWFKEMTEGNIVIMGRHTLESLGMKPLPNRTNFVISKTLDYVPDCIVRGTLEEALSIISLNEEYKGKRVFIIGGETLYEYALRKLLVDEIHIDYLAEKAYDADTFFPDFHKYGEWIEDENGAVEVEHRKAYAITYRKR